MLNGPSCPGVPESSGTSVTREAQEKVEEISPVVVKSRRLSFKILAILGGSLVVLGVCEIGARIAQSLRTTPPECDTSTCDYAAMVSYFVRHPKDPNRIRILFLGDSFTRGVGVEPNESFVPQVNAALEKWKPGRYEAINVGVPGIDAIGEWTLYNRIRDTAQADLVVHVVSPRSLDAEGSQELWRLEGLLTDRLWISKISCLSDLVEDKIRRASLKSGFIDYLRGGSAPEQRHKAWRIFAHEMVATKRLVEEGGSTYVMVRFPMVWWFDEPAMEEIGRRGAAVASDLNMPYLDLREPLRKQAKAGVPMSPTPTDPHPSAPVHALAAGIITDWLTQSVLPKLSGPSTRKAARPRSPEEIKAASIQHQRELLEMEPNCVAARIWLDRAQAGM
jgi:hypothetical protein